MSTPKRFVSWIAVSSEEQAERESLKEQARINRQHIERHRGVLVEELSVPGQSRSIVLFEDAARKITAYARLKELIDSRAFDVLVYLDHSRLGRTASLVMTVGELCAQAGIILYETESPPESLDSAMRRDHSAQLIGAIKSVGAQHEVEKIRDRNTFGMIGRVRRGDFPYGTPWGWKNVYDARGHATQVVDTEAQETLLLMIDLYLVQGLGAFSIAEELNKLGRTAPTGIGWYETGVQHMLGRAMRFAGYTEVNASRKTNRPHITAKGRFPALIGEELAQRVLSEAKRRRGARRSVGSLHRFSQCVYCVHCGRRMQAYHSKGTYKGYPFEREVYACDPRHPGGSIPAHRVFAAVEGQIDFAQDEEVRAKLLIEMPSRIPHHEAEIARAHEAIERAKKSLQRADDAYSAGVMDIERLRVQADRFKTQIAKEESRILQIEAEIRNEKDAQLRGDRLDELAARGYEMLEEEKAATANAFFRQLIHIWVESNQVVRIDHI